jgi:coniferyl-aldehyde dehydrogenase
MKAAAEHLTPVTLELGGKSPAIVHGSYPLRTAAKSITLGKWFNAGQTCIAPDYVLVPEDRVDDLVDALRGEVDAQYPRLRDNADYTSIVNDGHYSRLRGLIDDAVASGARAIELGPTGEDLDGTRKIAPTLLLDVTDDMTVMQEEIFGPVLPIVTFRTLYDAIRYVNDHPRPLALYYFDKDKGRQARVTRETVSGGVSLNSCLLHFGQDDLPFGGVGPSGMGAYHAREGFETFSHKKAVFHQSRINAQSLLAPPYGRTLEGLLRVLMRA